MTRFDTPQDPVPEEEVLRELFNRTAAPLSDHAALRLEAAARRIPAEASPRHPLLRWWLAAVASTATAAAALLLWSTWELPPPTPEAPAVALSGERDASADAGIPEATLAVEQDEGWELSLNPFGDEDETPSLVGSVTLAHGLGDPAQVDLWVQAADEILTETGGI